MSKRVLLILAALPLLLLVSLAASAQQQPTYIMVSEWTIPRAQWTDWVAFGEKNAKPIYEKFAGDGTILSWGTYANIVHVEGQATHASWYETSSLAGIEKVLAELTKIPPSPIMTAATTKHRDFLLQTQIRQSRAGSGTNGFLRVNNTMVQAGKGQQWRELWEKYNKPLFDEMLASGAILGYWVGGEQVHTEDPGGVFIAFLTPNAEGVDSFFKGAAARGQKRSAEENRAIGEAFAGVTVGSAHRDSYARVLNYGVK
jgi:hypothetical protein